MAWAWRKVSRCDCTAASSLAGIDAARGEPLARRGGDAMPLAATSAALGVRNSTPCWRSAARARLGIVAPVLGVERAERRLHGRAHGRLVAGLRRANAWRSTIMVPYRYDSGKSVT